MEKNKKFAVIRVTGKQYKVAEGDEILIDKLNDPKSKPEVLLYSDGEHIKIGKPDVEDSLIKFSVLEELKKGEKVNGFKYKAKSRFRKRYGFRHSYTKIKVEKLGI
jgi:large subunit ribosomal protein L21